jgi:hypothetical protein
MGFVTFAWWAVFVLCVVGLARSRVRRHGSRTAADAEAAAGEDRGPRLPAALGGTGTLPAARRPTFSDLDREILAPMLHADLGPDGVRCPGCIDGSVRRYLHRSPAAPGEVVGDVWCASCRRHMTLSGPSEGIAFEDPLAHLDDAARVVIVADTEEYLGGLDVLWSQGRLPQRLDRSSATT